MKVVSSLKRICPDCYYVKRGKKLYLRCTTSPRHKRRQGFSTLLYTGTASGDGTAPMNGLGSLPADADEVHEENEDHTGCI
jgi:ribosomal protein L36